jgi:ATP-dependent DNA helicase RecG
MKNIDDGFLIAQEDLEIRGPGEFFGTRQHGLPELRIGRIMADVKLMEFARRQAFAFLERDPDLSLPEDALIRERLLSRYRGKFDFLQGG